ncbi:MAG: HNH endonuclease, partial [Micromonosporaceae bacterium]|nr:HNH endonuclease [Micromonosporaceae bacterium]
FPACDRAPRYCHAHHPKSWLDGGPTCLANGVLLCSVHHMIIHSGEWQVYIAADGMPEFIPPPWIDEHQRPMRNNRRPPTPP